MTSVQPENNTELNPLLYGYDKEDELLTLIWAADPFQKNGPCTVPVLNAQQIDVHVERMDRRVAGVASAR
ncbi:hypothetical protein SK128_022371, partial [Halocaridina rubra]